LAKRTDTESGRVFHGVPAAPGIAVGPARRLEDPLEAIPERKIPKSEVDREIARFREALDAARRELTVLRNATRNDLDEETARIFDVQLMVLEDPLAVDRTEEAIRKEKKNAEFLFRRHMVEMADNLKALTDAYFSERAVDLFDVKRRVLRHLSGDRSRPRELSGVLMVRELAPSDAVMLQPEDVLGSPPTSEAPPATPPSWPGPAAFPPWSGPKASPRRSRTGRRWPWTGSRAWWRSRPLPRP
jgi:phosphotransferase system enzyme I (PtsI)